ncbi:LacI family DNA-binding transcriptional regulator [Opitutales bacterium ASA1]|uniref:LacI family DNA-binding transcriptional regulator n=1 Tax=Congregicoccus parvus TaxID=3081749 RepID=UPI002B2AE978|nr:LacI family DNA-binding transcriptional regulator [Opitutales bacterium ASA1]
MKSVPRVTHRDIALRLGCDKSTVSLALRDQPRISEAMRRRVRRVAEELGYRPDPALAMLARQRWAGHETGRGATLAYLVHRSSDSYVEQRRFLEPLRARAVERGYALVEFDVDDYPSTHSVCRVLHHRGIRGLVASPWTTETERFAGFEWDRFTVVGCGVSRQRLPVHTVEADFEEGVRTAARRAFATGARRMGVVVGANGDASSARLVRHFQALAFVGEGTDRATIVPMSVSSAASSLELAHSIRRHRPDIVFATSARTLTGLRDLDLHVPQDVAFALLDMHEPGNIAGIDWRRAEIARVALDLLIAQIQANCWGMPEVVQRVLVEPRWHAGATVSVEVEPALASLAAVG